MDVRVYTLTSQLQRNPGASEELLKKVQSEWGIVLPTSYADFMRQSNGASGDIGNSYLVLWPLEDALIANQDLQVEQYAPGLFLFGGDGGGEAYGFDTRHDPPLIVEVNYMSIGIDEDLIIMWDILFRVL